MVINRISIIFGQRLVSYLDLFGMTNHTWVLWRCTEVNDPKFLRQRSILLRLLHLVEKAVYIEAGSDAAKKLRMVLAWLEHIWRMSIIIYLFLLFFEAEQHRTRCLKIYVFDSWCFCCVVFLHCWRFCLPSSNIWDAFKCLFLTISKWSKCPLGSNEWGNCVKGFGGLSTFSLTLPWFLASYPGAKILLARIRYGSELS